jgi:hypothetical protein
LNFSCTYKVFGRNVILIKKYKSETINNPTIIVAVFCILLTNNHKTLAVLNIKPERNKSALYKSFYRLSKRLQSLDRNFQVESIIWTSKIKETQKNNKTINPSAAWAAI